MKTITSRNGQNTKTESEDHDESPMNQELHELFIDELSDLYDAEKQLTKALPKMSQAAQSEELREAFESHLEETLVHVSRLEEVAESLGEKLKRKPCKAMQGLVEEGSEIMKEQKDSSALDAGLIAAAQKVEHYEIASYGTVCAWAKQMNHTEALSLLEETLEEEKAADEKLTGIAEESANAQ